QSLIGLSLFGRLSDGDFQPPRVDAGDAVLARTRLCLDGEDDAVGRCLQFDHATGSGERRQQDTRKYPGRSRLLCSLSPPPPCLLVCSHWRDQPVLDEGRCAPECGTRENYASTSSMTRPSLTVGRSGRPWCR